MDTILLNPRNLLTMIPDKLLVVDVAGDVFRANRLFDRARMLSYPGASVFACLMEKAAPLGWQAMTGDVFLRDRPKAKRVVCWSLDVTAELDGIADHGAVLGVLTCGESPNVAWRLYSDLPRTSARFTHVCMFAGAERRVAASATFHPYRWPNVASEPLVGEPWEGRRLLALVASAKTRIHRGHDTVAETAKFITRRVWFTYLQLSDPFFRFSDLYDVRLHYVRNLAASPQFALFGRGWDRASPIRRELRGVNFATEPVPCANKLDVLSHFRFSLCVENCVFPGYVTEKLFDGVLAGTVPVYLGAPDIEAYVPPGVFVDARTSATPADLWARLESMSREEWEWRRRAASEFLASREYEPYKEETQAAQALGWIEGVG